jgi:hypothetical protein
MADAPPSDGTPQLAGAPQEAGHETGGKSKIADRPHWITITLTVAALATAGFSAFLSYRALRLNWDSTTVAQRAYVVEGNHKIEVLPQIEFSQRVGGPLVKKERFNFQLTGEVHNLGNTPAYDVALTISTYYVPENSKTPRLLDTFMPLAFDVGPKDVHQFQKGTLMDDSEVLSGKSFDVPVIRGTLIYRDNLQYRTVFQENQEYNWCDFYMSGLSAACNWDDYKIGKPTSRPPTNTGMRSRVR